MNKVISITPVSYVITLGATQQNLLSTLKLPKATLSSTGWSPTLIGTTGNDVFDPGTNSGGTAVMTGGGGNDVFYVHGPNDVVNARAGGINTVITDYGWGAYTLPNNVQNLIYDGTASYANGWITLTGNALDDTIVGNNLGVAFVAGTGNDTLVGGTGADIFVIGAGGNDTIINFHGGTASTSDTVQLRNLGFNSFAAVQAAMTQSGSNTVLNLGGGRTLTFVNQTKSNFTAAEFGLPDTAPIVAVKPTLQTVAASGNANTAIALAISAALVKPDPGEKLTIKIAGVPTGATLSAGTHNTDGTWSLTAQQLVGLTLKTPASSAAPITLTVTATATETDGSVAVTTQTLAVSVKAIAIAPSLTVTTASGTASGPVALTIKAALTHIDPGETLLIKISGVPSGAQLSAGTRNADGSWSLLSQQLAGLTLIPPAAGLATSLTLIVSATAVETGGSTATATTPLTVTLTTPPYVIVLGATQQSLLSPLKLPGATLSSTGWSPTLVGTAGNDVFDPGTNSGGTAVMTGGVGNDVFYVHGSNDVVNAQAGGINTVITDYGWGAYTLPDNVQNLIYDGTASFANGWISLTGNTLNDTIVANNLGVALVAGTGNDTLVGGTGADIFVIGAGGNDTIINFHGGTASTSDTVQLRSLGFDSFAAVQAAMTQSGSNTVLNLGNGRTLTFVNQTIGDFTAAEFGLPAAASAVVSGGTSPTGTSQTGGTPAANTNITDPVVAKPALPGQVVGFDLRNNNATSIAAHEVTFGQTFAAGEVPAGRQLVATINGVQEAVQMDVKTTYSDGSVEMAVLTLLQPALAASASAAAMLSLATPSATLPPISLSTLAPTNYGVTVSLNLHNADGTSTPYLLNVGALLQQALSAGTVTYILQGAQVTEGQFNVPISGSLYLTFDVSRFADGSTSTNISFNNDIALSASGGTANYDVTITQNGVVALQKTNITQYQYQTWNQEVYSNGPPQAQVVLDIAALEKAGVIPNYDLTAGVSSAQIAAEASQLGGATYGILGSASVTQHMPTTGGRDDIGAQPEWNVVWLMTQDPTAEAYALAQANAAGSVPWHFYSAQTDNYLTVTQYPTLWTDSRAAGTPGYTALTQQVSADTGWTPDAAHQPDLSYVAYMLTGDQQYLDQLNAQASWSEASDWTPFRQDGLGLVANGQDQVREQAWSLREVDEAAYANPAGSAMKTYFSQMETNNWQWLVSQIPAWTAAEGQAYGYVPGTYGATSIAPWEQDYFVSTAVEAAEQGNQNAVTFLNWESNFIVGRFLNASNGFNPQNGIAYNLTVGAASGASLGTWAAIEQASQANGQTNDATWSQSQGDYGQLALQSLAGIITVTESTAAMQAYGWLLASGAPQLDTIAGTQFDVVPRLSDGNLLTADHVIISTDTIGTTLSGSNNDQLIHAGSGNDTINGGSGMNLLFAGSGNDTLNGGVNNDYLFGGSGNDTFSAGAGINYMQAGSGADIFALAAKDVAQDMIASFKIGTDKLQIAGAAPSSSFVAQLLQTMTQDPSGGAVLHLSPTHSVTLQGISTSEVNTTFFK
jgi:Ca2+-binding RTX toxin-like protein